MVSRWDYGGPMRRWALGVVAVLGGAAFGTWLAARPAVVARVAPPPDRRAGVGPRVHGATDGVQCQLDRDPGPRSARLVEVDADSLDELGPTPVTLDGEWFTFHPRLADGLGWLTLDGHAPAALAWADGACVDLVAPVPLGVTVVYGRVVDAPPDVHVNGCGLGGGLDEDGTFELELPPGESCEVWLTRVFGTQLLRSSGVRVAATAGEAVELTLLAPEPPGAVGWDLLPTDGGLRVTATTPGGPAARAGLQVGDLVVSVGGAAAGEQPVADVLERPLPVVVELADGRELTVAP